MRVEFSLGPVQRMRHFLVVHSVPVSFSQGIPRLLRKRCRAMRARVSLSPSVHLSAENMLCAPQVAYGTGTLRADHDGHWKDALEAYLRPCLELFWPVLHAAVDWSVPPVFLDKELGALVPARDRNRRYVDKLVCLQQHDGEPVRLLLHIEVQGYPDVAFGERMYTYFTRLRERHPQELLMQCVVLTRGRNHEARLHYHYAPKGKDFLTLDYSLPVLQLQDWARRRTELLARAPSNPFALVVLAELEAGRSDGSQKRLR